MPKALRRKKSLKIVNKDGIDVSEIYCRKCMQKKPPTEFYLGADKYLDRNGYFSICKLCVGEIYVGQYNIERDIRRAIFKTCRIINLIYSESAIQALETQLKNSERLPDDPKIFGLYKSKIASTMRGLDSIEKGGPSGDLTFQYETAVSPDRTESISFEGSGDVVAFWGGEGTFSTEDYRFLEKELANFKSTHKADSYTEIVLLKLVCYKLLEIEKDRLAGKSTAAGVKELQSLMSSLAISPDKANIAGAGKSMECFGVWLKDIESFYPLEYLVEKGGSMYDDVDNNEEYGQKYITDPLRSFVLSSPDFGTDELEKIIEEDTSAEG